jgi:hypothetical protein
MNEWREFLKGINQATLAKVAVLAKSWSNGTFF